MTPNFVSPPQPIFYYAQVWELVQRIPHGKVATYGQIAALIPAPEQVDPAAYRAYGPRWVGNAMANCPQNVPWHRVVNSQGRISLRKGRGAEIQEELLRREGIEFDQRGRIDLERFGWSGPSG